ncbi:MAG: YraN family protein, partial [Acidimicrobiales bacterium]
GTPAEAVTRAKQAKLRLLARHYLDTAPFRPRTIRFDVAAILAGQIEIIEAAF